MTDIVERLRRASRPPLPPNRCTHPRARWIDSEGDETGIASDYYCPDCGAVFTEFTEPREQ